MKKVLVILLGICLSFNLYAKKFEVQFVNKSQQNIQLFYQIIKDIEKEEPKFIFNLEISPAKNYEIKLKRSEKIKFIGYGAGVETLPVIRDFSDFNKDIVNEIELVLPKAEILNILELKDVMTKLDNDNILTVLLDSSQYTIDKMPPLGTFIFYNAKLDKSLPLKPTFWKNKDDIRVFGNKYYGLKDHVSSANSAGLKVSGIPYLKNLSASFQNSNLLEIIWDVDNAHFEQWQPSDMNIFQIIADDRNSGFINSCVTEMNIDSLAGGDYKLYFISSIYSVDRIKISAKKYNKIDINADLNFNVPITSDVEVVKPVGAEISYGYLKEKLYHSVDSSLNVSLKTLALDYTSALNTHISEISKQAQKENAEKNAAMLKTEIYKQYKALITLDSTLIKSEDVEVIIPIVEITPIKDSLSLQYDSLNVAINPIRIKNENIKIAQFNSLISTTKEKITKYKETLISIENLSQPTNYYHIVQSITPTLLDKKVLDAYLRSEK